MAWPKPNASLAYIRAYYEWDWTAAEREFRRAARSWAELRGRAFLQQLRPPRRRRSHGRGRSRNPPRTGSAPRSLSLKANQALLSYFAGHYDEAFKELLDLRQLDPTLSLVHWGIGLTYEQKGLAEGDDCGAAQGHEASPRASTCSRRWAMPTAQFGKRAEAREDPQDAGRNVPTAATSRCTTSSWCTPGLGEKDLAFEWLERAYQERSTVLAYVRLDPTARAPALQFHVFREPAGAPRSGVCELDVVCDGNGTAPSLHRAEPREVTAARREA